MIVINPDSLRNRSYGKYRRYIKEQSILKIITLEKAILKGTFNNKG